MGEAGKREPGGAMRIRESEWAEEAAGQVLKLICQVFELSTMLRMGLVAPLRGGAQASLRAGAEPRSGARVSASQSRFSAQLRHPFRHAARLCASWGVR